MNLDLLNKIKQDTLLVPMPDLEPSDEFAGIYLHSNKPFTLADHEAPIRGFRVFSKFKYPILLFISPESLTPDVDYLVDKYDIDVRLIPKLNDIIEFNEFCLDYLHYLIPERLNQLIVIQADGWIIKSGWEDMTKGYSWLGAKWKEPIQVMEETFNLPPVEIGNGGACFRRRDKCLEVLEILKKFGGRKNIIKGIKIFEDPPRISYGNFLAEDIILCYFGFGLGIFEPVSYEVVDKFSLEPIEYSQYLDLEKRSHFFHRIDK